LTKIVKIFIKKIEEKGVKVTLVWWKGEWPKLKENIKITPKK
jgi:hypothetical protein